MEGSPALAVKHAHPHVDPVIASVPANAAFIHILRAAVAGVTASFSHDLDTIDDLRLAITEAAACLLRSDAPGTSVEMTVTAGQERVEVLASRAGRTDRWPPTGAAADLARLVLEATVHELAFDTDEDSTTIRFVRRRAAPSQAR